MVEAVLLVVAGPEHKTNSIGFGFGFGFGIVGVVEHTSCIGEDAEVPEDQT